MIWRSSIWGTNGNLIRIRPRVSFGLAGGRGGSEIQEDNTGPQPRPRLVRYRLGWGFPAAPSWQASPASRHTSNRPPSSPSVSASPFPAPDSQRPQPHMPAPGAQATSQPQALQERPLDSALATCCQGNGGPTQEQVRPSSPSPPGHGKQSPEETEKRYSGLTRAGTVPAAGLGPTEPELSLGFPPFSSPAEEGRTPAERGDRIPRLRWLVKPL